MFLEASCDIHFLFSISLSACIIAQTFIEQERLGLSLKQFDTRMVGTSLSSLFVALWLPNVALGTFYPVHSYLEDNCGGSLAFHQSRLLGYSVFHYSSIPRSWYCQVTLSGTSGRSIQVRFRNLETTYNSDCHVTRLVIADRSKPLTPPNGVCGTVNPSVLRTTDNTVTVSLSTDSSLIQYGDFELLITEFSYPWANGSCSGTDFKCNNGICISADLTCNGYNDCDDNSDEIEGCGLSTGVVVGIVFGVICFFIVVFVVGFLYHRRRRQYVIIRG